MGHLIQLATGTLVLMLAARYLPGVRVASWSAAFVAALAYAILAFLLNLVLTAAIVIITLPLTIITFTLFLLLVPWIVNTIILRLTAGLLSGFDIDGWTTAFMLSFLYTLAMAIARYAVGGGSLGQGVAG